MRIILWIPLISFWVAVIMAQKTCSPPGELSCNNFNRVEAAKPSCEVSECGGCLDGYYEPPVESTKKADSCMKKVNSTAEAKKEHETNTTSPYVKVMISIFVLFVIVCLYVVHAMLRCKWNTSSVDSPAAEGETVAISMVQDEIRAANASLALPYKSQKISNGKSDEVEETNTFSSIQEHSTNFSQLVNMNRPGHARPFHPPFYVHIDPSYNPDDRLNPSGIVNEPTTPSRASSGDTIPVQALAALTEEAQDSMRNSSLQRPGSPSPSTNQEGHGNGENNDDYSKIHL